MSIITQSQNQSYNTASAQSSATTSSEDVDSTSASATQTAEQGSDSASDVQLSTRAQKLQKLEQEFFPGGYLTLEITPEFVQRLQDYGFISASQAEALPDSLKGGAETEDPSQIGRVLDHAETLLDKLEGQEQHGGLIDAIKSAHTELEKIDSGDTDVSKVKADIVSKRLAEQLNEPSIKDLSEEDIQVVKNLMLSLELVSSFAAGSSSSGISSYSNGFF